MFIGPFISEIHHMSFEKYDPIQKKKKKKERKKTYTLMELSPS
jgi:hypothetical protein